MKYTVVDSYEKLSRLATNLIASQITVKPSTLLGLATGSTPLGTYKRLAELCKNGDVDFSGVTTVNLDEYAGIDRSDVNSYYYFMNTNLFDHVNIDKNNTYVPNGKAEDLESKTSAVLTCSFSASVLTDTSVSTNPTANLLQVHMLLH